MMYVEFIRSETTMIGEPIEEAGSVNDHSGEVVTSPLQLESSPEGDGAPVRREGHGRV